MCNCPIEIKFDDNEFIRVDELIEYASGDIHNEDTTFKTQADEVHTIKCRIYVEILYCPACDMENERLQGIE